MNTCLNFVAAAGIWRPIALLTHGAALALTQVLMRLTGARGLFIAGSLLAVFTFAPPAQSADFNVSTAAELKAAIDSVNAGPGGDAIFLAPGLYRITSDLNINQTVSIEGDESSPTVIDGGGLFTILNVRANSSIAILNLTLQKGSPAIRNEGSGAIFAGSVTITGSNTGVNAGDSGGRTFFTNSTITNNIGPGIAISCAELHLTNVTVSNNGVGVDFGLPCGERMQFTNSLIVRNGQDCGGGGSFLPVGVASFDSDGSCVAAGFGPGLTRVNLAALGLGNLAANGGPTMTQAIPEMSRAVNAGDNTVCPGIDQRGVARPQGGTCDIGAYEFFPLLVGFVPSAGTLSDLSAVPETILPVAGKPIGVTFPFGLYSWTVTGLAIGQSIVVTMTFPSPVASPAQYWKIINGVWTDVTPLLGSDDGDNVLTLTITDGGPGDADGLQDGRITDPGGIAIPVGPALVPFAALDASLEIERREFELDATFTLGAASNGIRPLTEDLHLEIGGFAATLPAGSFKSHGKGRFKFKGMVSGVRLEVTIRALAGKRFKLEVEGKGVDLSGAMSAIPVSLTIGDDQGTASVTARIESHDSRQARSERGGKN